MTLTGLTRRAGGWHTNTSASRGVKCRATKPRTGQDRSAISRRERIAREGGRRRAHARMPSPSVNHARFSPVVQTFPDEAGLKRSSCHRPVTGDLLSLVSRHVGMARLSASKQLIKGHLSLHCIRALASATRVQALRTKLQRDTPRAWQWRRRLPGACARQARQGLGRFKVVAVQRSL